MTDHVTLEEGIRLRRPALVCAFSGWNDAGQAASVAARYLAERWDARTIGHLDPEEFLDFQVTRPTVRLEDGVSRVVEWPSFELRAASPPGRDVIVLVGAEPNNRWRTFTSAILGAARDLGVDLLVTLGAFLADVPHTRPVPLTGSAPTQDEAHRLGLTGSQYEGPTGITGVLHDAAIRAGMASISLWAAVPHYLPSAPDPKAALALVERTTALLGVTVETGPLEEAAAEWDREVASLVAESDELSEYVERLEGAALTEGQAGPAPHEVEEIPSAEAIAAEVERYLREQGERGERGEQRNGGEGEA